MVKSIGRGGLFDGSRISVDDFSADSLIVSTADTGRALVAPDSPKEAGVIVDWDADVECEGHGHRQSSGATSSANNESTTSRAKVDLKKGKKCVSFDDVPFVIGSDIEQDDDGTDAPLNDVTPFVTSTSPPTVTVPKAFEIVEKEGDVPNLPSSNTPAEGFHGSPISSGTLSVFSEVISPWSTENELSDSSAVLAPGQFSIKQVEDGPCTHRDKTVSSSPFHPRFLTDDLFVAFYHPRAHAPGMTTSTHAVTLGSLVDFDWTLTQLPPT